MDKQREVCKKKGYVSIKLAHAALNRIKNKSDRLQVPTRAYFCEDCNQYHLTKYPKEIFRSRESSSFDLMDQVKRRLKELTAKLNDNTETNTTGLIATA